MKTKLAIIFALCVLAFPGNAAAQDGGSINVEGIEVHLPDLNNPRDQEKLKERAKQCVKTMNSYITSMTKQAERDGRGEMHPTMDERRDFRKAALTCFLNNGDSIILEGVKTAPPLMEISTKRGSSITYNTRPVKQYFTNLIRLITSGRYTELKITSSDIGNMDCTNIQQVGSRYQCIVCFRQEFIGRRGEVTAIHDHDTKCVTVWFEVIHTQWGDEVEPRLGDTKVTETDGTTRN